MSNKIRKRFALSFLPFLALNFTPWFQMPVEPPAAPVEEVKTEAMIINEIRAEKINSYFAAKKMPLAGYGEVFVREAEKHEMDWRLLPAISIRESTGGKFACGNNPFGWGSCRINFENVEHGIETVALNIAGKNPRTEKFYAGHELPKILWNYNGGVVPAYPEEVIWIMNDISPENILIE